jgi:hypothetical protein
MLPCLFFHHDMFNDKLATRCNNNTGYFLNVNKTIIIIIEDRGRMS